MIISFIHKMGSCRIQHYSRSRTHVTKTRTDVKYDRGRVTQCDTRKLPKTT